jgi:uncharacterized protein YodC (DUF2158 family)
MSQINQGDVVQLKSGGPKMTVSEVKQWNGSIRVWCDWFEGTKPMRDSFLQTSLELAEDR